MRYTGPLWDSDTLKRMFVQRANAYVDGVDKSQIGILLVGHGQPDEWDVEWPTETEQELGFRHDVLQHLALDGFKPEHLSLAWMDSRSQARSQGRGICPKRRQEAALLFGGHQRRRLA